MIINGKDIKKSHLRTVTRIAKQCHERNCVCKDCDIVMVESLEGKCTIKDYVEAYILLGMLPKLKKGKKK